MGMTMSVSDHKSLRIFSLKKQILHEVGGMNLALTLNGEPATATSRKQKEGLWQF